MTAALIRKRRELEALASAYEKAVLESERSFFELTKEVQALQKDRHGVLLAAEITVRIVTFQQNLRIHQVAAGVKPDQAAN